MLDKDRSVGVVTGSEKNSVGDSGDKKAVTGEGSADAKKKKKGAKTAKPALPFLNEDLKEIKE